ncbi:hypothetical protein ABZ446_41650 [Streptomyces sp. NPDC005813]|uniref:hypothetical protein n=1 Tax=Streptomyces sp. NPDC005813 TaxID=3155592 RepID=UPI0033D12468
MNSRSEQDTADDNSAPWPKWTEEIPLRTVDAAGIVRHVTMCLSDASTALIALLDANSSVEFSGVDYLDCLTQARRHLEREGRLLCCQGARPNVHPSGQLRQFTNGRHAYDRHSEPGSEGFETVDIFAPASPADVVNLDDQRAAVMSFFNARYPKGQI